MARNQLGDFWFISLHSGDAAGPPDLPGTQVEIIQRPGYPGSAVIDLADKGKPFQMRSFVDVPTMDHGILLAKNYKAYQGKGPYGMWWCGVNYLAEFSVVFVPLEVNVTRIKATRVAVGGLYPPSLAVVECMWTLLPMAVEEEE